MAGGNLATSGAVSFQFTKQGIITIKSDAIAEDQLIEQALEAGAEDVKNEGEVFVVITTPVAFLKVKEALTNLKIPIEASEEPLVEGPGTVGIVGFPGFRHIDQAKVVIEMKHLHIGQTVAADGNAADMQQRISVDPDPGLLQLHHRGRERVPAVDVRDPHPGLVREGDPRGQGPTRARRR